MIKHGKLLLILTVVAGLISVAASAGAQTAKVTAVVLYVQYQSGGSGAWKQAKVGTQLPAGSTIRTQKRSKCEVKFPDGSYVRLGPRSQMVVQRVTGRQMRLKYGSLFGHVVAGHGARIESGKAVAAVKGTDVLVQTDDGPPIVHVWNSAGGVDWSWEDILMNIPSGFGTGGSGGPKGLFPVPPPFFAGGEFAPFWIGLAPGMSQPNTPGGNAGFGFQWSYLIMNELLRQSNPGGHHYPANLGDLAVDVSDAPKRARTNAVAMLDTMKRTAAASSLSFTAQPQEIPVNTAFGKRFFGPYIDTDAFGLWGEGKSFAGVRARPHGVLDDWYIELGAMGLTEFEGDWDTFLSEAFAATRSDSGEITLGRQHYLEGPVNNSDLGTLLGFTTFDGARWKSPASSEFGVDIAYVNDYYPFSGAWDAHGWVGRFTDTVAGMQLGANVVHDSMNGTGYSIDVSTSPVPLQLDLYGEFGTRPDGQHIETWGVYFPQLYQTNDIDLFVEYAERGNEPGVLSLAAYKEFDDRFVGLLNAHKEMGNDVSFSIGGLWSF